MGKQDFLKRHKWELIILFLLLLSMMFFNHYFYGIFGNDNYVTIHLIIEIFIIVGAFTIAIQAWFIVPYLQWNKRLYIGALFCTRNI